MLKKVASRGGLAGIAVLLLLSTGCTTMPKNPIPHASQVDVEKFMGAWYVIANIPTRAERGAHNSVERYERSPDGTIATTFTFNEDSFEGKQKRMSPKGFVRDDPSHAIWGMQFIWPIKAEYVISHVDPAYRETIVARSKRDYVWIMARTPTIPDADYARLVGQVRTLGYDTSKLVKVPQQPQPH